MELSYKSSDSKPSQDGIEELKNYALKTYSRLDWNKVNIEWLQRGDEWVLIPYSDDVVTNTMLTTIYERLMLNPELKQVHAKPF